MSAIAPSSTLFSPLRLGPIEVANRFAVPAMVTRLSGDDGFVNDDTVERYRRFSEGGAGLIEGGATAATRASDPGPPNRATTNVSIVSIAASGRSAMAVTIRQERRH